MKAVAAVLVLLGAGTAGATNVQGALPAGTTTWTLAQSPYVMVGDVQVPTGSTLRIDPGVTVQAATSDATSSGSDVGRVELIVEGTLTVAGTPQSPVTFTCAGGPLSWYGIHVKSGGAASVSGALVEKARYGFRLYSDASITRSTLRQCEYCVITSSLTTVSVTDSTLTDCTEAAVSATGEITLRNALVTRSGYQPYGDALVLWDDATLVHNTIVQNLYGGVYWNALSGHQLTLTDNIISSNNERSVYRGTSGTLVENHNDIWNHRSVPNFYVSSTTLSADPKLGTDHQLQAGSPCIGTGNAGTDMGAFPYVAVSRVVLTPSLATVTAGGTLAFTAQAYDANNNPLPNVPFTWTALAGVGTLSPSGVLTAACTPRTVTDGVQVSSGGVTAKATVTITAGAANRVTVAPASATLGTQSNQSFSATVQDACGNALAVPVTWSLTGSGTIDSTGKLTTGCTLGAATVRSSAGAISGTSAVTVVPGPAATVSLTPSSVTLGASSTQSFTAAAADACNHPVTALTWSATVGTVSPAGTFTAPCQLGTFTGAVRVTSGSRTAAADVTVVAGSLSTIQVSPTSTTVGVAEQRQFSASGRDSCGNPVATSVTWSATPTAGTVNASGLFTAGTVARSFTQAVRATSGSTTGTADVTVLPGPAASLELSPLSVTLPARTALQLATTAKDAYGNPVSAPASWSITAGGSITSGGLLTAGGAAGHYPGAIRASSAALTTTADLTVTPGAPSRVVVSPPSATMGLRGQTAFSAQVFDADSNPVPGAVAWAVSEPSAGSIDASGLFTAKNLAGSYPNLVRATAGPATESANVTVQPGALTRLVLTPASTTVRVSERVSFSAAGEDADGNPVPVATAWAVLHGGGTIDASGSFQAGERAGEFQQTVQALAAGVAATATVVVQPGPAKQGTVTPRDVVLLRGQRMTFTAAGRDAYGNILDGGFTWSASPHAGRIEQDGTFTAGNQPGTYVGAVTAVVDGVSDSTTVTVDSQSVDGGELPALTGDAGRADAGDPPIQKMSAAPSCGCGAGAGGALPWGLLAALGALGRGRAHRTMSTWSGRRNALRSRSRSPHARACPSSQARS